MQHALITACLYMYATVHVRRSSTTISGGKISLANCACPHAPAEEISIWGFPYQYNWRGGGGGGVRRGGGGGGGGGGGRSSPVSVYDSWLGSS